MIQVVKIYDLLLSPSCAIIIFVELSPGSPDSHRDVTLLSPNVMNMMGAGIFYSSRILLGVALLCGFRSFCIGH